MIRLTLCLAVALLAAACGANPAPTASASVEPGASSAASAAATATGDPILAIASGPWRRQPVQPSDEMTEAVEAACRASEAAIAGLPVALVDLRGESRVTLVFADGPSGYACWSALDQPAVATVVQLKEPTEPIDGIDVAHYQIVAEDTGQRSLIIGRVGEIRNPRTTLGAPIPARVIAGFTDETFVWATYADPWYAMWWPGTGTTDGVAVTNTRNEVITGVVPKPPTP